jgi:hypothetical protein
MEIQNVSGHLRCYNCDNREKPVVECRTIEKNNSWETFTGQNKPVFLPEGKVHAEVGGLEKQAAGKGFFRFVPAGRLSAFIPL